MKAVLRTIRISPKKANLVAGTVRGKKVNEALAILKFMPKKGADIIYKVVLSAASNAKNNFKQNIDDLVITRLLVTKGPTYKRSLPISRGRAHPIRKRTSHITVEVGLPEGAAPAPVKKEEAKKAEAPKKEEVKKTVKKAPAKTKKTTTKQAKEAK
jgi:large subunit ribosomal protein L22